MSENPVPRLADLDRIVLGDLEVCVQRRRLRRLGVDDEDDVPITRRALGLLYALAACWPQGASLDEIYTRGGGDDRSPQSPPDADSLRRTVWNWLSELEGALGTVWGHVLKARTPGRTLLDRPRLTVEPKFVLTSQASLWVRVQVLWVPPAGDWVRHEVEIQADAPMREAQWRLQAVLQRLAGRALLKKDHRLLFELGRPVGKLHERLTPEELRIKDGDRLLLWGLSVEDTRLKQMQRTDSSAETELLRIYEGLLSIPGVLDADREPVG